MAFQFRHLMACLCIFLAGCQSSTETQAAPPEQVSPAAPAPKIENQTPLSSFDFNQPFAMSVTSLGCGIGCPIYKLMIQPDFTATFEGIAFVKEEGKHSFLIKPEDRTALKELLSSQAFRNIQAHRKDCRYQKTDALRYQVALQQGDKSYRTLIDKHCYQGPIKTLENILDNMTGRWKGRHNKAVR